MRAGANEDDRIPLNLIDEQEVAADVTFAVVAPFTLEWMIQPFRRQGRIIGYEKQHRLFQPTHVEASRARKALPILCKTLRIVRRTRREGPLAFSGLFHRATRSRHRRR